MPDNHIDDEMLEQYALGTLNADVPSVEEHLLLCASCQDRYDETLRFVSGMRIAGRKLREEDRRSETTRTGLLGWRAAFGALALAAAGFIVLLGVRWSRAPERPPAQVQLVAMRSASQPGSAPLGRRLALTADATGLGYSPLRFVVVDGAGRTRAEAGSVREGVRVSAVVDALPAGLYFVRLHGDGGALEREFRLEVR